LSATNHPGWYLVRDGKKYGPITDKEMSLLAGRGYLKPTDQISRELAPTAQPASGTEPLSASAPEKAGSGHSVLVKLWNILARGLEESHFVGGELWRLITRPRGYAQTNIDADSHSLRRAWWLYLKLFSLAFLFKIVASQFEFYSGVSEARLLGMILFQVCLGFLFLFGMVRPFYKNVSLSGLLETILAVDGAFLIVWAILNVPISYFDYHLQTKIFASQPDIYNNAVIACLAQGSFIYNASRKSRSFLN
jgi:hypothetical protein